MFWTTNSDPSTYHNSPSSANFLPFLRHSSPIPNQLPSLIFGVVGTVFKRPLKSKSIFFCCNRDLRIQLDFKNSPSVRNCYFLFSPATYSFACFLDQNSPLLLPLYSWYCVAADGSKFQSYIYQSVSWNKISNTSARVESGMLNFISVESGIINTEDGSNWRLFF